MFAGTIADNIKFGYPDASEEDVVEAAKAANAHDFIERLPDKYDTEAGGGGSGIAIAIAIPIPIPIPIIVSYC